MQIVVNIPDDIMDTIESDEFISREQLAVLQMHILKSVPLPEYLENIKAEIESSKYLACGQLNSK